MEKTEDEVAKNQVGPELFSRTFYKIIKIQIKVIAQDFLLMIFHILPKQTSSLQAALDTATALRQQQNKENLTSLQSNSGKH